MMKIVGVVSSVLEDDESPSKWVEILGGPSYARVITKQELINLDESRLVEELSSLLICGLEPLERFKNGEHSLEDGLADEVVDINALANKLLLQSLITSDGQDLSEEQSLNDSKKESDSLSTALNRLIIAFSYNQGNSKPVVGVGHGAIQVCRAMGGDVRSAQTSRLRLERILESTKAISDQLGYDLEPSSSPDSLTLPVMSFASFESLPADTTTIATGPDNKVVIANIQNKALIVCGHPEETAETLLERWFPLLDDNLALDAAEAERMIQSVVEFSSSVLTSNAFFCDVIGRFLYGKHENEMLKRLRELEARVAELEKENEMLRRQLYERGTSRSETLQVSKDTMDDMTRIRSVLAGAGTHGDIEEIEKQESGLFDLTKTPKMSFGDATEIAACKAPVVSLIVTPTGLAVFGTTDKRLQTSKGETIMLDTPAIALAVRPLAVPIRIACGTLSGRIEIFTQSPDGSMFTNRVTLKDSPHEKHICGIAFDPLGSGKLATASKDGKLCFWGEDFKSTEAKLGFHIERPPECICDVVLGGKSYVAVGKRNDNNITLVPFDSPQDMGSHINVKMDPSLSLGETPFMSPLAMSSLRNLPLLAVATDKSKVVLYDLLTRAKCREFYGHICGEFARPGIAWDSSGDWIAVTSDPSNVFAFRVSRPEEKPAVLSEHSGVVRCVYFGINPNDGRPCLYSAGMDKRVLCRPLLS